MGASEPHLQHVPFDDKVFVMGGDFRQVLLMVRRGDKAAILAAFLTNSPIWRRVTHMRLTINMRVQRLSGAWLHASAWVAQACQSIRCQASIIIFIGGL